MSNRIDHTKLENGQHENRLQAQRHQAPDDGGRAQHHKREIELDEARYQEEKIRGHAQKHIGIAFEDLIAPLRVGEFFDGGPDEGETGSRKQNDKAGFHPLAAADVAYQEEVANAQEDGVIEHVVNAEMARSIDEQDKNSGAGNRHGETP